MQAVEDRETLYQCPFEPSHVIRKYRIQLHLAKCTRCHPQTKKGRCIFDTTHYVDEEQMPDHLEKCPTSGNIKNSLLVVAPTSELGVVPISEACATESKTVLDEDWNGNYPTYDPMLATQNKMILRTISGAPKSERRAFRAQERCRISKLEKTAVFQNSAEKIKSDVMSLNAPLRRPKAVLKETRTITCPQNTDENNLLNESMLRQFDKARTLSQEDSLNEHSHIYSESNKRVQEGCEISKLEKIAAFQMPAEERKTDIVDVSLRRPKTTPTCPPNTDENNLLNESMLRQFNKAVIVSEEHPLHDYFYKDSKSNKRTQEACRISKLERTDSFQKLGEKIQTDITDEPLRRPKTISKEQKTNICPPNTDEINLLNENMLQQFDKALIFSEKRPVDDHLHKKSESNSRAQEGCEISKLEKIATFLVPTKKTKTDIIAPDVQLRRPKATLKEEKTNICPLNNGENSLLNESMLREFDKALTFSKKNALNDYFHNDSENKKRIISNSAQPMELCNSDKTITFTEQSFAG